MARIYPNLANRAFGQVVDSMVAQGFGDGQDQGRAQLGQQVVEAVRDFPVDTAAGRQVDWERSVRWLVAEAALGVEFDPEERQQVRRKLLQR